MKKGFNLVLLYAVVKIIFSVILEVAITLSDFLYDTLYQFLIDYNLVLELLCLFTVGIIIELINKRNANKK